MSMLYVNRLFFSDPVTEHEGIKHPSLLPTNSGSSKHSTIRSEGKHFLPELLPRRRSLLQGRVKLCEYERRRWLIFFPIQQSPVHPIILH